MNGAIDKEIEAYGTLVHGDVKGANIVFNRDPYAHRRGKQKLQSTPQENIQCALYDFQYVGLGLGTLDLVYFLATSADSILLSTSSEAELLRSYHSHFLASLSSQPDSSDVYPFDTFMDHWELAVVDWYRFMAGWGFWGNDDWIKKRAEEILSKWNSEPPAWLSTQ